MALILQVFTACGPEREICVANKTLRDKTCLVPCTGLYADIADDSLIQSLKQTVQAFEQNVAKGKMCLFLPSHPYMSGVHMLTHDLRDGVIWDWNKQENKEHLYVALRQMFPISAEEKVDEVKSITESYLKYKRDYTKQLCFNPDNENLSRCFFSFTLSIHF